MANALSPNEPHAIERANELLEKGAPANAAALLRPLVESGRGGLFARLQYARALLASNDIDEALAIARETALLFPNAAAATLGLGEILLARNHLPTAIAEFQRALRIDPCLVEARLLLGKAWLEAGEPDKALRELQEIEIGPGDSRPEVSRLAAEAERMRSAARSNARYVRHLFDQFSADYDSRMLTQLGYSAPRILRNLATLLMPGTRERSLDILDLGCGTGLAGLAFADLARRIDGIDLSPAMIEKARARGLYTELYVGDVEALQYRGAYDLVIAADTLVYIGDLAPLFTCVASALRAGGNFLFTVEKHEPESFELGPKRRWRHSDSYLRTITENCGLEISGVLACTPRTEASVPVEGLAVAVRKPL